jgi:F0F1-type ATP synthase membrane subunit c/vacuolar-type H+-ATPase subunit K
MDAEAAKLLGAGLAIAFGAIGPGIGLGLIGAAAMSGIARNPEARDRSRGYLRFAGGHYPGHGGLVLSTG